MLTYASDFDTNGLVHLIGTDYGRRPFANPGNAPSPQPSIKVTASSLGNGSGSVEYITSRRSDKANNGVFYTKSEPNSWVMLDLGDARVRAITQYTLRGYTHFGVGQPRNWTLEASADAATWRTLRAHVNGEER